MASYLDAGGARYADGGAFHGYIANDGVTPFPMPEEDSTSGCTKFTTCYGSIVTKTTLMRQTFDQHGLAGKPMFDTEGSWGDGTVTDPDTQVAWLVRWYLLQGGLRSTDNLQLVAWFTWGDPATFHWGTIETDAGMPTQAGIAFNQVYAWLMGAAISQPCSSASDGTWTCSLTRPGGYSALAVWNTQGSKSYTPSVTYADFRDLAGNTVKITKGEPITIGAKPILLETPLTPQTSMTTTSERTGASMSSSATTSSSVMPSLQYPWQVGIGLLVTAVVLVVLLGGIFALRKRGRKP
jgi:hypothetical protein